MSTKPLFLVDSIETQFTSETEEATVRKNRGPPHIFSPVLRHRRLAILRVVVHGICILDWPSYCGFQESPPHETSRQEAMPIGQPFDELVDQPESPLNRLAGAGPKCGTGIILPPDRAIGEKTGGLQWPSLESSRRKPPVAIPGMLLRTEKVVNNEGPCRLASPPMDL